MGVASQTISEEYGKANPLRKFYLAWDTALGGRLPYGFSTTLVGAGEIELANKDKLLEAQAINDTATTNKVLGGAKTTSLVSQKSLDSANLYTSLQTPISFFSAHPYLTAGLVILGVTGIIVLSKG